MNQQSKSNLGVFEERIGITFKDRSLLARAFTHRSYLNENRDVEGHNERLEFLGDAVLRLAASEFLEEAQPQLAVGERSRLRAQLVSDRWLAELGDQCGIEAVLRIGAMATGDHTGRATLRAEACEAVIGALYRIWGDLTPVHRWLSPHWLCSLGELQADPDRHNWKSALQEWSQGQQRGLPTYHCQEVSQRHGDPRRFHSQVSLEGHLLGEGWGGSRRQAEQVAAQAALETLRPARGS